MVTGLNVLVVDDNPQNLKVLSNLLKTEGYKLALALNGKSALEILDNNPIDLVMLDIMMPEMDGYEVCRQIKEKPAFADLPIIFISALDNPEDIVKALVVGGVDYVVKPFNFEEIKARVATHLKVSQQNKLLKQLNQDKDRFISILAHDLRNPFNALLGYSDLLVQKAQKKDFSDTEKNLHYLQNTARSIYDLLEDTLLWARVQSGKLPFDPREISFVEACDAVIFSQKMLADLKNIVITNHSDFNCVVKADSNMFSSIMRNLLTNAIKFTRLGGTIDIYTEVSDNMFIITIADNGVGLSSEAQARLFNGSSANSTKGTQNEKGSGMGLTLCKEFIEKHGGRIWVESQPDQGSNFKFTLPAVLL